jgi:hypothetical protein
MAKVVASYSPSLVIVDGLPAMLAAAGVNQTNAPQVREFIRTWLRPLVTPRCAVLVTDLPTKKDRHAMQGRGGGKDPEYDVSWSVQTVQRFSPTTSGLIRLTRSRDRYGLDGDKPVHQMAVVVEEGPLRVERPTHRRALPIRSSRGSPRRTATSWPSEPSRPSMPCKPVSRRSGKDLSSCAASTVTRMDQRCQPAGRPGETLAAGRERDRRSLQPIERLLAGPREHDLGHVLANWGQGRSGQAFTVDPSSTKTR